VVHLKIFDFKEEFFSALLPTSWEKRLGTYILTTQVYMGNVVKKILALCGILASFCVAEKKSGFSKNQQSVIYSRQESGTQHI